MCLHPAVRHFWGFWLSCWLPQQSHTSTLLRVLCVFTQKRWRVIIYDFFVLIPQHLVSCYICEENTHACVFWTIEKAFPTLRLDEVNKWRLCEQDICFVEVWDETWKLSPKTLTTLSCLKCVMKCWTNTCQTPFSSNIMEHFLFTLNFVPPDCFPEFSSLIQHITDILHGKIPNNWLRYMSTC